MRYEPPPKYVTDRYRRIARELSGERPSMLLVAQILCAKMAERRASNKLAFGEGDALELVFAIQRKMMEDLE